MTVTVSETIGGKICRKIKNNEVIAAVFSLRENIDFGLMGHSVSFSHETLFVKPAVNLCQTVWNK